MSASAKPTARKNMITKPALRYVLAALAGALGPLSLSPFDWWPFGFVSIGLLYWCLQHTSARQATKLGFCFGLGLFGVGTSWVYVSIHDYGNAGPLLAGLITFGLISIMASYFAAQCWLWQRVGQHVMPALSFSALWLLGELWRGWFLTGFPWLYYGYAHVTSPLSGLAPLFGVHGLSLVIAVSSTLLVHTLVNWRSTSVLSRTLPMLAVALLLVSAVALRDKEWTTPLPHAPLTVGIVQANIPQELKFESATAIQDGLNKQVELSNALWQQDLVLWSETAIPLIYEEETTLIASLDQQARAHGSALITGVFSRSPLGIHNSVVGLGQAQGIWLKQKLVPFGEYVPFYQWLSNLLEVFQLPLSSLSPGPRAQNLLQVDDLSVAPFICYEVVYPGLVRRYGREAHLLVTISNDTWFGSSFGPWQHLQIATMRARELGRYMVRGTNNGVSAIVAPNGVIISQSEQFIATTLQNSVLAYGGLTPYARWGSWPVALFSLLIITMNLAKAWNRGKT
jgi:apolipoprotein N-acyltransferase